MINRESRWFVRGVNEALCVIRAITHKRGVPQFGKDLQFSNQEDP